MEDSQIVRIKEKLKIHARYLNDEVFTHTDIAKRFSDEANKETFFHDGQVARAVAITTSFKLLFSDELKEKGGE